MPKNEKGEVKCLNNPEHKMDIVTQMGVIHLQKKPESSDTNDGGNLNLDVHICLECQYTEMYSRPYDKNDPNNISSVRVEAGW